MEIFKSQGWEIATVAGLTDKYPDVDDGIKTYLPKRAGDMIGVFEIDGAIKDFKPDILYMTADTGSVVTITSATPDVIPGFAYIPVEGEPIANDDWKSVLANMPMLACSKYGVDLVRNEFGRTVDFAYHGIDHDVFKVNGRRDSVRQTQRWDGKFVIMCVAQNVRRKQIPRLMEAVSILKYRFKQDDIILYLHTVPFQNYWLEGWNLPEIARSLGIEKETLFHPAMNSWKASIPEQSPDDGYPGLADIYNAADLFVLPSQVEGFGLPIAEAMACGVPVIVTKYAAGWEIASPAGRGIIPHDWEIHKSGTRYANIDPMDLAKEILRLKRNPKERERMRALGLERAKDYTWDALRDKLVPAMEESYRAYQERRLKNKRTDTLQTQGHEDEHLRTLSGQETGEVDTILPKRRDQIIAGKAQEDHSVEDSPQKVHEEATMENEVLTNA